MAGGNSEKGLVNFFSFATKHSDVDKHKDTLECLNHTCIWVRFLCKLVKFKPKVGIGNCAIILTFLHSIQKSRLKSTFLPYHVKKHHSTLEMDTFKIMLLLSYLASLDNKPRICL